jgi:hypothetical protein
MPKINELTAASALTGAEIIPLMQGGATVRATAQAIANLSGGGGGATGLYDVTVDGTATGDGVTDDKAAIEAAITAAVAAGKALWFPPGTYRIAGNITITSPVHIMGLGGAGINASGDVAALSILEFDQGYGLTLGTGSRGYNIENIAIQQGATHEAGTKDGVTILEKGVFRNVTVRYFGGDGFAIATALGNEVTETMWFNCWVYNCAKGWSIETGNSSIFGGAAYDCREQGVFIANVFGCTVVGTKLRGCNSGGVGFQITGAVGDEDGQGQHLAIGCGVSGGNGTIYVGASAMWIGGASGAGFATTSKGLRLSEQDNCSPINVINNEGTIDVQSTVGVNGTAQVVYQWQSSDDGDEWRMFYDETTNYAKWAVKQMGESTEAYALTHNDHVQGAGIMAFPQGFVLGASGNGRIITSGSAAPSGASRRPTGNWWQGDIVYNNAPTAGGTLCWVCVTDGNPGTWKTVSINA